MSTTCNHHLVYVTILNKPIPENGRYLSRREVKLLQAQSIACSAFWEVRQKEGATTVGILFDQLGVSTGIEIKVKLSRFEKYGLV